MGFAVERGWTNLLSGVLLQAVRGQSAQVKPNTLSVSSPSCIRQLSSALPVTFSQVCDGVAARMVELRTWYKPVMPQRLQNKLVAHKISLPAAAAWHCNGSDAWKT